MLTNIALLSLAVMSTPIPGTAHPRFERPRIELWTHRGDGAVYRRGESVQLYFRLDQDAYVTIFRIDTDGRVRVLFPREPWEDNFARGGHDFEVDGSQLGRDAFAIDDYPGVGYLFAVAAPDPFVYEQIESGDHWDYRVIADGRVRGDPYVALTDLAQRIVPEGYADWDYDVTSYNVEQQHDYPRFLCYDCHSYVSYPYWDPYIYSCVRFRMYVYDDPFYYPYRYYGGSRVVFVRPYRPQPRFIFKDWGGTQPTRDGFVTRERERPVSDRGVNDRPVNDNTRRGVTGRDLGGLGIMPPPDVRDRRDPNGNTGGVVDRRGDDRSRRDVPERPDRPEGRDRPGTSPEERPMVLPPRDRSGEQQPQVQPRLREVEPRRVEPRGEPRSEPRRDQPRRVEPRNEPRRVEPRSEPRRAEPRNEPRSEPRSQPRAEPRNEPRSQPRAEPRNEPRSQPRAEPAREKPRNEPEVRRRKP